MPSTLNTPNVPHFFAKLLICFSTMCPLGVSKPPRFGYAIRNAAPNPAQAACSSSNSSSVKIPTLRVKRLITCKCSMTDVPLVEHLCMTSIFFLPPTSSVQQHFGVRLLWGNGFPLHFALPVEAVAAAAVSNHSYDSYSNSKSELNLLTGETMTSSQPRRRSKPGC